MTARMSLRDERGLAKGISSYMLPLLAVRVLNRTDETITADVHHNAASQLHLLRGSNQTFLAYSSPSPTKLSLPAADECLSNPPITNSTKQPIAAIKSKPLLSRGSSVKSPRNQQCQRLWGKLIDTSRSDGMPQ